MPHRIAQYSTGSGKRSSPPSYTTYDQRRGGSSSSDGGTSTSECSSGESMRYARRSGSHSPLERQSLLGRPSSSSSKPPTLWTRAPLLLLIIVTLLLWSIEYNTNTDRSSVRSRLRSQWAHETQAHNKEVEHWAEERARWGTERASWAGEESAHDLIRREWTRSVARHEMWVKRVDEQRAEWDQEAKEHVMLRDHMLREARKWEAEQRTREEDRIKQREEDAEWRKRAERRKEEEEERERAELFFASLSPGLCTSYKTRKYESTLMNIPIDFKGSILEACMSTPGNIHGRTLKPTSCEVVEGGRAVRGTWDVDFNEPGCTPWWSRYKDKGCTAPGSGIREIEQHLENLYPRETTDWRDVCSTTPSSFLGLHLNGPDSCANWGSHEKPNLFGYWRIEDNACR